MQIAESPLGVIVRYSAVSGVHGLAVPPDDDEKIPWSVEVAEDATDCLRCVTGSHGNVSMAKKLDVVEGQPEDVENELNWSSPRSIFGAVRVAAIISTMTANCRFGQTSCQRRGILHQLCQLRFFQREAGKRHTSIAESFSSGQNPGLQTDSLDFVSGPKVHALGSGNNGAIVM